MTGSPFTQIYLRDRQNGTTELVSRSSTNTEGNGHSQFSSISAGGRYVAFDVYAGNLIPDDTNANVGIYVYDRLTQKIVRADVSSRGVPGNQGSIGPEISASGRYVAFGSDATNLVPGDTNRHEDVFLHDLQAGTTERVSVSSDGDQGKDSGSARGIQRMVVMLPFSRQRQILLKAIQTKRGRCLSVTKDLRELFELASRAGRDREIC